MSDLPAEQSGPASPYDPPGAPIERPDRTLEEGVAQGHSRARWVVWLLAFGILVNACAILSGFMQQALLARAAGGVSISHAEASANDVRHASISLVVSVTFLLTAVAWLLWMHRAYSNLQSLGSGQAEHRAGWAVGCWFVPVLNLFRPFQITKELWLRSRSRNLSVWARDTGTPALLGWWWGVRLGSGFFAMFLAGNALSSKGLPQLQSLTTMGIVNSGLSIVSGALALGVVRSIDRLQAAAVTVALPEGVTTQ